MKTIKQLIKIGRLKIDLIKLNIFRLNFKLFNLIK